jgi:hypothetical protein
LVFSGDQRSNVKTFLTTKGIAKASEINMHGY